MPCTSCKRDIKIVSKGLCDACRQRFRKHGTTEYQRIGKRSACQIQDCQDRAVSHGLCDKHRQRLRQHGTTDLKHDSWGAKWKHPLRHSWMYLRRFRGVQAVDPVWIEDFLQFIADVGERPSRSHKLFAADNSRPLGPGNFVWKRAITERVDGEDENTFKARRQRVYRAVAVEATKASDIKKRFGLTYDEYDRMMKAQDSRCGICGNKETALNPKTGQPRALAIDHCHKTGAIRGLLCTNCNRGIGNFREQPALFFAAIAYLQRHEKA